MRTRVGPLIASLSLCLASPVLAARSLPADHPVAIKLEMSQPTAVALPEPVASVSVGLAPDKFSLDYDGPYLFLLPLDPTISGRLFIVGQSGKLYTLTFKVAAPADDVVHVIATPSGPAGGPQPQPFSVASLLRALRTGTAVPGQQTVDLPLPALPDARVSITASQAVALGTTLGLVLALRNAGQETLALDLRIGVEQEASAAGAVRLQTWTLPPRLTVKAVAADDEVLAAGGQTRVYFILERRP